MTHATHIDPHALAARLRLWALGFVATFVAWLGGGPLPRNLRLWARGLLTRAESGAMGIILLAALQGTPYLAPPLRRARRPLAAARGFQCRDTRTPRIAQMTRGLFARERNIVIRARRLARILADIGAAARRVLRRLLKSHAWTQLVAIAPPAALCATLVEACVSDAHDTS